MGQLKEGISTQTEESVNRLKEGAVQLEQGSKDVDQGALELSKAAPVLVQGIQSTEKGADALKTQGTESLVQGAKQLDQGLGQLVQGSFRLDQGVQGMNQQVPNLLQGIQKLSLGSKDLKAGTGTLKAGSQTLAGGMDTFSKGLGDLESGAKQLAEGTGTLTGKNGEILSGMNQLDGGAVQLADGALKLHDGSKALGDGLEEVKAGTETLKGGLEDGAKTVKETPMNQKTEDMFAAPVNTTEKQMTTVENNGHAMAPYMMSVALWVGCIAFSLMYPLTKYHGKLKSGFAWWASKASVLYLVAISQAVVMIGLLHFFDGFEPVQMTKTIAFACLASVAFMSVMYFFTNTFGKVGSFLMLIFMVIQLAGSVGTYPLELSGSFVPYLHDWVPFTYTVEAFRSTIAGGESIRNAVIFLIVLWLVFTGLTILEFQIRAVKIKKGKPILESWLEKKGLA